MLVPLVTAAQVAFWGLAPIMVLLAIGMVISRKPAHSALCLGGVMLGLAVQYAVLEAPFLFVTQIIVYTGSVMMLFVFTMMLIGVDSKETMVETLKGHRIASLILVVAFAALLIMVVTRGVVGDELGMERANSAFGGNVEGIAALVVGRWVVAFEATAALLITGALASMVLAHSDVLTPKERQKARLLRRMREYADNGSHIGPLPNSGVYARHNAIHYPALLPDGSVAESSVSPTLVARGVAIVDAGELREPHREAYKQINAERADVAGRLETDLSDDVSSQKAITAGEPRPRRGEEAAE